MNTNAMAETFFLISSVGFIILFIILATLLYYLIRAVRSFNELTDKIERSIDTVGDASRDLIDDMRNSMAFRLLFKGRRK